MKEKRKKEHKRSKKHKSKEKNLKHRKHIQTSSSSSNSDSEEWVEVKARQSTAPERDDWMSMTGVMKTYTKEDLKPKRDEKMKNHIDSYNPGTSSRELNPYWKEGGTGLPETSKKSREYMKPLDDDDDVYFRKSSSTKVYDSSKTYDAGCQNSNMKINHAKVERTTLSSRSYNWKKRMETERRNKSPIEQSHSSSPPDEVIVETAVPKEAKSLYLSDEKLNKLAAKVVKAEIMGDTKLYEELKAKLDAAREYRKQNPDERDKVNEEGIMLISTNSTGNSRPLMNTTKGDARSKGGKRKAETHISGERSKYFGNDDKYNLAQMFQEEKYGNNYDNDAELAKIATKHKNPNDDLEDIFLDNISRNRNEAKEKEAEKQRAINQHIKIQRSLDGCEYCVDSKNMLKHLMVSCGSKVYVALPARQSLVTGQCIISTIQHSTSVTSLDEDVWDEVLTYRKALTRLFNSQGKDVVFFEMAIKLHRMPHMVINCVPLPRDVGDTAAIYFKKALLECEMEWSMNKKVVDLKGKDIRKGVPKGLPYFWVDFGMDPGFAHVIEDQQLFPKSFGEEIIGGILDLNHNLWMNPKKEYGDVQRKKVLDFMKEWKPFEPTVK